MADKLTKYDNGMVPMPGDRIGDHYNGGTTEPCDMYIGPCSCGAWHHVRDWSECVQAELLTSCCCEDDLKKYPFIDGR